MHQINEISCVLNFQANSKLQILQFSTAGIHKLGLSEKNRPSLFRNLRPLMCFHICSSVLLMVSPVSLHINLELQQNQKITITNKRKHQKTGRTSVWMLRKAKEKNITYVNIIIPLYFFPSLSQQPNRK